MFRGNLLPHSSGSENSQEEAGSKLAVYFAGCCENLVSNMQGVICLEELEETSRNPRITGFRDKN
jgi:hypothetical protein